MNTQFRRTFFLLCAVACANLHFSQADLKVPAEDEFEGKKTETKFTEVVPTDSLGESDLMKRAAKWMTSEAGRYRKTSRTTSGNKAECLVSFPIKPKELNPEVDYTGKITMKVKIECKNSRYRYTVYDIRHESKSGKTTAGSIDNEIPECGSVSMHDMMWKKVKAQALHDAALVVADLKEGMATDPVDVDADEW